MTGYRRAHGVAIVEEDVVVYAAILPGGPIAVLDDVAAVIWTEACNGPGSTIADRVAAVTGSTAVDIRDEVESFVDELVRRGLLTALES
jgi:hypothetical protein